MKISYSAPGKIILSGEHAVVYGKPALVTAIDRQLTFHLIDKKPSQKRESDHSIEIIKTAVVSYLQKHSIPFEDKPFDYEIESDIPIGRGMGSSAALSVASTAAVLQFFTGKEYDKSVINSIAYQGEKHFHKNPSGVDVSASCFGGLIYFRKEFEFLKQISSLNFKIPQSFQERLVLIDTGKPEESTGEMVELVGKNYNEEPKKTQDIFNEIEKITKRMVISIATENIQMFRESLEENERLLEELGVVSDSTMKLLNDLKPYGVGKISGAGGKKSKSGLIIFFCNDKQWSNGLEIMNYEQIKFIISYSGVNKM